MDREVAEQMLITSVTGQDGAYLAAQIKAPSKVIDLKESWAA